MVREQVKTILVMCADRQHPVLLHLRDLSSAHIVMVECDLDHTIRELQEQARKPVALLVIANGTETELQHCLREIRAHSIGHLLPITLVAPSGSSAHEWYPDLHINSRIPLGPGDASLSDSIGLIARYWLHLNETPAWELAFT